ncbi:Fatty-acid amide hydrolase 1, partial [Eschrichtius robustus]|nr:Fatty-acid amide hydrolase 1 [Eschrichtius robustus]
AWEVNKGTNCVTTYLADCETQLCQVPRQGLLYGIPVSLKECFSYKGQDSTLGLSLNEGAPAECDSVVVQVLKRQGALPFVYTNVPQSMFSYDCGNPLFGQTVNPWKSSKSPGGSSGGEGALIAAGGSPLGLGTDIGGSIRFPSAFCGICGLKPTGNRISKSGLKGCVYGQVAVQLSVGPMARDVESLALCLRALLCEDMFHLDPTVPPLPFREECMPSYTCTAGVCLLIGGATLLEKLYVCWDSDMGHGGNGEGAGGNLSPRRGAAGLGWWDASG